MVSLLWRAGSWFIFLASRETGFGEARSMASWCVRDVYYVHGSDMILDTRESI